MVGLSSGHRYYIYQGEVDLRKGFDGLHGLVVNALGKLGQNGEVYVFFNPRRTQVKMLVRDRTGLVIYYKRLEGEVLNVSGVAKRSMKNSVGVSCKC